MITNELHRHSLRFEELHKPNFFVDLYPILLSQSDLIDLADKEPAILLHMSVSIRNQAGRRLLESKSPLTTLLCHGICTAEGHVTRNGLVDTSFLFRSTSQYLAQQKLPSIDLFFSCDDPGSGRSNPRWDQDLDNSVIGASGSAVKWSYDNIESKTLVLDLSGLNPTSNPFFDNNHPKRNIVNEKFKAIFQLPKRRF